MLARAAWPRPGAREPAGRGGAKRTGTRGGPRATPGAAPRPHALHRHVLTPRLATRSAAGATAAVPLYDKSLRGGRGDRAPQSAWPVVTGPLQVVCLEGWCLGFRPLATDAAAAAVHPGLGAVNAALRTYEAAMESRVDAWVVVRVAEPNWVFDWRLQAEVEMRKSGKPGLTDAQVADFVSRFMPAYKAYLPVRHCARFLAYPADKLTCVLRHLQSFYKDGPTGRANAPRLALDIDATRMLIGAQ